MQIEVQHSIKIVRHMTYYFSHSDKASERSLDSSTQQANCSFIKSYETS